VPARKHFPRGSLWRHRALGSVAVYEILDDQGDDVVVVAVREAPGLQPGTRLRLTADAVAEMEPLPAE
jgi:hypothetical protein